MGSPAGPASAADSCNGRRRSKLAREGRFDYFRVESTGISEPPPVAEPRLGRRTVLTL